MSGLVSKVSGLVAKVPGLVSKVSVLVAKVSGFVAMYVHINGTDNFLKRINVKYKLRCC